MTPENETEEGTSTSLVTVAKAEAMDVFKSADRIRALVEHVRELATADEPDVSTPLGRSAIRTLAAKVKRSKTYLDGVGKDLVDDLKALPKLIDASRKLARDELDALAEQVRAPLTEWEANEAAAKAAKAAEEEAARQRVAKVQADIEAFRIAPLALIGKPSAQIIEALTALANNEPTAEAFGDRLMEAQTYRADTIEKLTLMAAAAKLTEDQQQAEHDRRVAAEATAAANRDAEQKIIDAKVATERAEAERKAADQRAIDAEAARLAGEERAEQARIAAEAKAVDDARLAAEHATYLEQKRAAAVQAEADRIEKERAANVEHCKSINNAAVTALMSHVEGLSLEQARGVVKAIAMKQIKNVSINY